MTTMVKVTFSRQMLSEWPILLWSQLSKREFQVALKTLEGKSLLDISKELFISHHTVRVYARSMYRKLGVRNRVELVTMELAQSSLEN